MGQVAKPRTATVGRRGLRLVGELVGLHPGPFALAVAGAALFAAATVAASVVLGRVTDRVVVPVFAGQEAPPHALAWSVAAVAAVALLRVTGIVTRRFFASVTGERVQVTMRHRLVDQYLGLPLSWHRRTPTGQLLSHADSDTEMVADVLSPLPYTLGVAFLALFSTIALIRVDPVMAGVGLVIFPALALLNRRYSARVEGPAAAVQAGIGRVAAIAHESFDGALVVKTLGRAGAEGERFAVAARALQASRVEVGYIRARFEAVMDALPNLGVVAVVVVGSLRISAGAMTRGDLVQVASLFTVLALPMRMLGFFLESLPPSVVSRDRLATVFDEPRPDPAGPSGALPAGPMAVEARGLRVGYDGQPPVLDGVDLAVAAGEVVAVVGATGAGKSTLCLALAGLIAADAGEVRLAGQQLDRIDPAARTDAVALVFQESFLFADSVEANVDLAGGAPTDELWSALAVARADQLVEELPRGLQTVLGERGVTLSGGQRQRVALARALLRRPRLLLLDDATSAVDPVVEQEILAGLRNAGRLGATVVLVAQRVSTIELADRVLYLAGGPSSPPAPTPSCWPTPATRPWCGPTRIPPRDLPARSRRQHRSRQHRSRQHRRPSPFCVAFWSTGGQIATQFAARPGAGAAHPAAGDGGQPRAAPGPRLHLGPGPVDRRRPARAAGGDPAGPRPPAPPRRPPRPALHRRPGRRGRGPGGGGRDAQLVHPAPPGRPGRERHRRAPHRRLRPGPPAHAGRPQRDPARRAGGPGHQRL